MRVITKNDKETFFLGKDIGKLLKNNTSIYLIGEMASGKTQLSKGIADAFGLFSSFSSPTYTIINEYKNEDNTLYHMDAYRIEDISELDYIGFYDIYKNETMIIEWADIITSELEDTGIVINIKKDKKDFNKRIIDITAYPDSTYIIKKLEEIYE